MPVAGMQAPTKGGREQPVTASRGRTGPPRHPVLSAIRPRKGVASVGRSVLGDVFRRSHGESNRSNRRVVAGPYHPQSARALVGYWPKSGSFVRRGCLYFRELEILYTLEPAVFSLLLTYFLVISLTWHLFSLSYTYQLLHVLGARVGGDAATP